MNLATVLNWVADPPMELGQRLLNDLERTRLSWCHMISLGDRRPSTAAYPGCWAMVTQTEIVCEEKMLYRADQSNQGRIKNLLNGHDKPYEQIKEGPLHLYSFAHLPVSTVSRGHLSLVSLLLLLSTLSSLLSVSFFLSLPVCRAYWRLREGEDPIIRRQESLVL